MPPGAGENGFYQVAEQMRDQTPWDPPPQPSVVVTAQWGSDPEISTGVILSDGVQGSFSFVEKGARGVVEDAGIAGAGEGGFGAGGGGGEAGEVRAPDLIRDGALADTFMDYFDHLNTTQLAVIVGASAFAVIVIIVAAVLWAKRRRRKPFDPIVGLEEMTKDIRVKSAPTSRSPSPKVPKRMSCPDALNYPKRSLLVRSLTADRIPDFTLPPERVQPRANGERGANQTPLQYQQSLIGSLQPDLYSHSSSFSEEEDNYLPMSTYGRLWYSLVYDAAVEQLNVTLIKVKDLPGRGSHRHPRDPYVKVFLLPDDKACRTSKVRKKTLSPIFNENFVFQVATGDLRNRVLRFSVYDVDKRKVRHSLGHIIVPLRDVDLGHVDTYWADLEPMSQAMSSLGDLQVTLCYVPQTEKIKVGIMKARNLKHADIESDTRVYLRLQMFYGRKVHRTKRTGSRPGSLDVDINESLSFSLTGKQLDSCHLEAALMITTSKPGGVHGMLSGQDVEYGRVVIGPFMYARGEELIHWQEMLQQPRVAVTRWHTLSASAGHE